MKPAKQKKPLKPKACGLCGKTRNLTKTPCCDNWICDDSHKYVPFSYAKNSCFRNHERQTLCAFHYGSGHTGNWWQCKQCREYFTVEEYVFYGTNDFNFKKLENPPKYPPILCGDCGKPLSMFTDDYQIVGGKYFHAVCPIPRTPVVTEKSVSEVLDPLLRYLYWPETLLTAALAEFDKMPRPIPGEEECKKAISEVMETLKATRSNIAKGILASYWCSPSVNRVVHELSKKHPAATFNPPK